MAIITEDMISDKIIRKDMLPLSFLKKSAYTGSKRSFNYKLEKTETELPSKQDAESVAGAENGKDSGNDNKSSVGNTTTSGTKPAEDNKAAEGSKSADNVNVPATETVLRVYWWTGLRCYDATPPEEITSHDVEFSDAGIDEAIAYLNEMLKEM